MAIFTAIATTIAATFFAGSALATTLISAGLGLATSIGLSYAAKALAGDPKKEEEAKKESFSTQGTLQAGGDVPRSFNLGYSATAGSLVWANTHNYTGQTPNAYLTQVIALADYPGGTLEEVWINGELVTLGAVVDATLGKPVTQYDKDGKSHLWVKYYNGTQTTADALCVSYASSAERPYAATRVGVGVAYVVVTSMVDDTLFNGFPSFKFAVSGVPLYDPSKDSTVGGSGPHVYSNPATWGGDGDDLPAVQIYNLLRGFRFGGEWFYGLQNTAAARLPVANWITQINKCRAVVDGEDGPEPAYRSGGQIRIGASQADAIEAILTACQGRISEIGGFYKIHLGEPDTATFSFTDEQILSTDRQVYRPFFALSSSVNGIQGTYPDPDQGWNVATAPAYYRPDLEVSDGNRRLMAKPSFDFVPYTAQVQRLQKSAIEEAQRARTHTLALSPMYWIVEPGDVGSWTSVRNGYSDKLFRVDGVVDRANLDVSLSLTEVDPADFDWDHELEFTPIEIGPTVLVRPEAQAVGGWTVTAYIIEDGSGFARRPGILLGWDGTQPGIVGVKFEVRIQATGEVILRGRTDNYPIGSVVISSPAILPLSIYEVRGQYIPSAPRDMLWSSWIAVTTSNTFLTAEDFDAAVKHQIELVEQANLPAIEAAQALLDQGIQFVASIASNQDARNWIDQQSVRSQFTAQNDTAMGRISSVETISLAADAAMASRVTTVEANVAGNTAAITTNATAISALDTSFASYQTLVSTQFGTVNANVATNATAISDLNTAFATYQTLVASTYATQASLNTTNANVSTNSTAISNLSGSLASYMTTATANATFATQTALSTTNANVTTNSNAISTINGALGSYVTTATANATYATLSGLASTNASVTTNSTAIATLNGQAAARWSLTLDVNNYVTGLTLLNGGAGVSFACFIVDKFYVAFPGVGGGTAQQVFTVANVGGSPKVALRGDMIVDGSITTQHIAASSIYGSQIVGNTISGGHIQANTIGTGHIAANQIVGGHIAAGQIDASKLVAQTITSYSGVIGNLSVETLSIGDNAITVPVADSSSGAIGNTGNAWVDANSFNLNFNTVGIGGRVIKIIAGCTVQLGYSGTGGAPGIRLLIDGAQVAWIQTANSQDWGFALTGSLDIAANGGNESHNIRLQWAATATGGPQLAGRTLWAMVGKR